MRAFYCQVKNYIPVYIATFFSQLLGVIQGFFVAAVLGPSEYGILTALRMISQLNKYGSLGFHTVVSREASYNYRDKSVVTRIKNNAYTGELILASILLLIGVSSSFFVNTRKIELAVIVASVGLFFSKLAKVINTEAIIEKKYKTYSTVLAVTGMLTMIGVIATVKYLGIFSSIGIPIFSSGVAIFIGLRYLEHRFTFTFDISEMIRLVRIGVPVILQTVCYGGYRYIERLTILIMYDTTLLGLYGFSYAVLDNAMTLLLLAPKIRKIRLSEMLADRNFHKVHRMVLKETGMSLVLASCFVSAVYLLLPEVIRYLLPKYVPAISILKLLSLSLLIRNISPYVNVVLISPLVNKQSATANLQLISTIFFLGSILYCNHIGVFSFQTFLILDVTGYLIFHALHLHLYYKHFYVRYAKDENIINQQ